MSGDLHDPMARQRYSERELRALAVTAGQVAIDAYALGDERRDNYERDGLLRGLEDELSTELRELLCPSQIASGVSVSRVFHLNSIIHDIATLSMESLPAVMQRVAQSMGNPFHRHAASRVLSALAHTYGLPGLMA